MNAAQSATASATARVPGGERRQLEHAHRPVPEHGRRARSIDVGVGRRGLGPDVEALPAVGDRAAAHDARLGVGGDRPARSRRRSGSRPGRSRAAGGTRRPCRARTSESPTACALREQERERHRAADEHRVAAVEQRVDHAELVADLRAAEHRDERLRRRRASRPREHLDLAERAAARRRCGRTRGGPTIDACARCDAPNASFT